MNSARELKSTARQWETGLPETSYSEYRRALDAALRELEENQTRASALHDHLNQANERVVELRIVIDSLVRLQ